MKNTECIVRILKGDLSLKNQSYKFGYPFDQNLRYIQFPEKSKVKWHYIKAKKAFNNGNGMLDAVLYDIYNKKIYVNTVIVKSNEVEAIKDAFTDCIVVEVELGYPAWYRKTLFSYLEV